MKKNMIVRFASLLLAGLLFCALVSGCSGKQPLTLEEQLELGMRHLSELDYENAVIAFTAVIEIDPQNVQGYAGLYSAYAAQGEMDLAEQTWAAMQEAGVSADEAYRWVRQMTDAVVQAGGDEETVQAAAASIMPEPEPTPSPEPEVLPSDDWRDMQIVVEGVLIRFPTTAEQLASIGYTPIPPVYAARPGQSSSFDTEHPVLKTKSLNGIVYNLGTADAPPTECPVYGIVIAFLDDFSPEDAERPHIKLAGGITLDSKMQDVLDAYGEPDEMSHMDDMSYDEFHYRTPEGRELTFVFLNGDIMTLIISRTPGDEDPAA